MNAAPSINDRLKPSVVITYFNVTSVKIVHYRNKCVEFLYNRCTENKNKYKEIKNQI